MHIKIPVYVIEYASLLIGLKKIKALWAFNNRYNYKVHSNKKTECLRIQMKPAMMAMDFQSNKSFRNEM